MGGPNHSTELYIIFLKHDSTLKIGRWGGGAKHSLPTFPKVGVGVGWPPESPCSDITVYYITITESENAF